MKSNYIQAIKWIDEQLTKPTREVKILGETIHDLNFSLRVNRNHILENRSNFSMSAYGRTKKIKDFLEK
jgi:hypothetical protein